MVLAMPQLEDISPFILESLAAGGDDLGLLPEDRSRLDNAAGTLKYT